MSTVDATRDLAEAATALDGLREQNARLRAGQAENDARFRSVFGTLGVADPAIDPDPVLAQIRETIDHLRRLIVDIKVAQRLADDRLQNRDQVPERAGHTYEHTRDAGLPVTTKTHPRVDLGVDLRFIERGDGAGERGHCVVELRVGSVRLVSVHVRGRYAESQGA